MTAYFAGTVEDKFKLAQEIEHCRGAGLWVPEPLPHPDEIFIDARSGTAKFAGPMTLQEKAWLDQTVTLMKVLQVQASPYATTTKRAPSKERPAEHLAELCDYQRQFDQMNDLIAPRYRIELQDRNNHPRRQPGR